MLNGYCALNFFESHLAHHYRGMCEIHLSPPLESRVRVGGLFVFFFQGSERILKMLGASGLWADSEKADY